MKEEQIKGLIEEANAKLDFASEESMKPQEDVVHFSICHNSRVSIRMYLASFLLKNGIEADKNASIMDLVKQCREIDSRFANINLSEVECRGTKADKNHEYCLSLNKVGNCFDAANAVKNLVIQ